MKKLKKIIALLLSCMMLLGCFSSCAADGDPAIEIEKTSIGVNTFRLFLSRMKGTLCTTYSYGAEALKDSFWDTVMDAQGTTYNDYYTNIVLDNVKTYLAAVYLFDKLGLKLPSEYNESIKAEIDDFIEYDGNGSKSAFNAILAEYGANIDILEEAYLIEAKISYLRDHLFGVGGSKIADEYIDDYYESNYVRFKQIFFYTFKILYETDENGDNIYYSEDGRVCYDTTKTPKTDSDGNKVKDKNGDVIFVDTETGKIAYNIKKGERKELLDSSGNIVTEKYSEAELRAIIDQAQIIMEEKVAEGNYTLFDTLVENYGYDQGMVEYPNGYYMTAESDYDAPEVLDALFEMEDGEVKMINSDYGIHIVMKYKLEDGGYALESNSDFFVDANSGNLIFMSDLLNELLDEYLAEYKKDIVVNEEKLKGIDIKSVGANFYY